MEVSEDTTDEGMEGGDLVKPECATAQRIIACAREPPQVTHHRTKATKGQWALRGTGVANLRRHSVDVRLFLFLLASLGVSPKPPKDRGLCVALASSTCAQSFSWCFTTTFLLALLGIAPKPTKDRGLCMVRVLPTCTALRYCPILILILLFAFTYKCSKDTGRQAGIHKNSSTETEGHKHRQPAQASASSSSSAEAVPSAASIFTQSGPQMRPEMQIMDG
eukprot:1157912-Pelagomonas_calceolata.AAC.2